MSYLSGLCARTKLSLSGAGRQRRRSWRFGLDDKRAESGRNWEKAQRHWLELTHEGRRLREATHVHHRQEADLENEEEEDADLF